MDFATSWRHMGTVGKIEAIRAVWVEGCSASQIAATFKGVSRNAVIGMYNRYGKTYLSDTPLQSPPLAVSSKARTRRTYAVKPAPLIKPPRPEPLEPTEYKLAGKPLMMLQAKECRFPVNDAEGDQLHLFCARPTERSYCAHHAGRVYRSGER